VTYVNLAQLLSAAIVILLVGGLYKAHLGKWFAPEPKSKEAKEPNQDSRFKSLAKLFDFWIVFGALILLILVLTSPSCCGQSCEAGSRFHRGGGRGMRGPKNDERPKRVGRHRAPSPILARCGGW